MFIIKKAVKKRISDTDSERILARLDSFLKKNVPKMAYFLHRAFDEQMNAVTYRELREAAMDGYEAEIIRWQEEYVTLVNERLSPMWLSAMNVGATHLQTQLGNAYIFDNTDRAVKSWMEKHTADFVTNINAEARRAVKSIVMNGQAEDWTADQMARAIRPCIGQNLADAQANLKYQKRMYANYRERMTEDVAQRKAHEVALKYASRQHRARADMIANTELALAYNCGAHESVRQAMEHGLLGLCVKVWSTAGSERTCPRCMSLNGKEIGFEDKFPIQGKELYEGMHLTPPAHPRCRCAIKYKELAKPKRNVQDTIENPTYRIPKELGQIDFTDKTVVQSTVEYFEKQIVKRPVENAVVILRDGRVLLFEGELNGIPTLDTLGHLMNGAVVTHNHPLGSVNEYSFSRDDMLVFQKYGMETLRGIDERYVYELNRSGQVDSEPIIDDIEDFYQLRHCQMIWEANSYGFGYYRRRY